MTDDEYVAHVRARMWEKTHEHILEERARRERAAEQRRERERVAGRFHERVEASLRRGEERRREKGWRAAWEGYERAWAEVVKGCGQGALDLGALRIWPVKSGDVLDVGKEAVEEFFRHAPLTGGEEGRQSETDRLRAVLKAERVRWHPDKMQQRYGRGGKLDAEMVGHVTAVFQCVDALWSSLK